MMTRDICGGLLRSAGIRPDKNLGQNFLCDQSVIDTIVDAVGAGPDDTVVEIGCGIGALTVGLCTAAGRVIGIELDTRVLPVLEERLRPYPNHRIINADALEADFSSFGGNIKVVGNLPYYITTDLMKRIFAAHSCVSDVTVMMQTEVAAKVTAKPGKDGYGLLSLMAEYCGDTRVVTDVEGSCFFPPAPVRSTVLHIDILPEPRVQAEDEQKLFRFIKDALLLRRKTLPNSLAAAGYCGGDKAAISRMLTEAGIEPTVRAEKLSLAQLAELSRIFSKK